MPVCFKCNIFLASISKLISHLKIEHKLLPDSIYRCREKSCFRDFSSVKSFKKHFYSKHVHPIQSNDNQPIPGNIEMNERLFDTTINWNSSYVPICDATEEANNSNTNEFCNLLSSFCAVFRRDIVKFIVKIYSLPNIPRNVVQLIIDYVSELFSGEYTHILKMLLNQICLISNKGTSREVEVINKVMTYLCNPFANFDSEYKRFKYLEEKGLYIKPVDYIIGNSLESTLVNGNISLINKDAVAHFIPLRKLFTKMFQTNNFYSEIVNYIHSLHDDFCISNIYQTAHWKRILENFNSSDLVLPIGVYFDDFETGNPLGSRSGIHKLGGVYVSILTCPIAYAADLENIFLAALFHSRDRKNYGNTAKIKILVDELQYLETNGIEIVTHEGVKRIYFVVTLILGDNLGLHSLLGFTESFNSNICCRFCIANKQESRSLICENPNLMRTVISYDRDLNNKDVASTGIKERCIFNQLPNFHVVQNFYVDVMHDLLEGICHYDMLNILNYLIVLKGFFSLEILQYRISTFNFDFEVSNVIPLSGVEFKNKPKLSVSATEMLCLVRYFSIIIGDLVPLNDKVWHFYLVLKQILLIVCSNNIVSNEINLLELLIKEHNQLYVELFNKTLKPKFHHLVHYPNIMRKIGPIMYLSSLRYEAKHRQSKIISSTISCKINLTLSVAIKHQLNLCLRFVLNKGFSNKNLIGPFVCIFSELIHTQPFLAEIIPKDMFDAILVKWVKVSKYMIKENTVLVLGATGFPEFGLVYKIIVRNEEIYVLCKRLMIKEFSEHYHAFEIDESVKLNYEFISLKHLISIVPVLKTRNVLGKVFVSLRCAL